MSQMLCMDEQMISIKGMSSVKQCILINSHKNGYKMFLRCDSKGILHNIKLYTGCISPLDDCSDLVVSSNVIDETG